MEPIFKQCVNLQFVDLACCSGVEDDDLICLSRHSNHLLSLCLAGNQRTMVVLFIHRYYTGLTTITIQSLIELSRFQRKSLRNLDIRGCLSIYLDNTPFSSSTPVAARYNGGHALSQIFHKLTALTSCYIGPVSVYVSDRKVLEEDSAYADLLRLDIPVPLYLPMLIKSCFLNKLCLSGLPVYDDFGCWILKVFVNGGYRVGELSVNKCPVADGFVGALAKNWRKIELRKVEVRGCLLVKKPTTFLPYSQINDLNRFGT